MGAVDDIVAAAEKLKPDQFVRCAADWTGLNVDCGRRNPRELARNWMRQA